MSEQDAAIRFPVNEWENVALQVNLSFRTVETVSKLKPGSLYALRFIGGYLMGYPHYVDNVSEKYGAAVRKLLFIMTYGRDNARAVISHINQFRMQDDQQVKLGWGCGAPDGKRYFQAVEERRERIDTDESLVSAVELGWIDVSCTIL